MTPLSSFVTQIILVVLCLAGYQHSLNGDFVFDDIVAIVKNPNVYNPDTNFSAIFLYKDFWGNAINSEDSHKSYRPLTTLMFHVERSYYNFKAKDMKIVNLLCHCINTILFWRFIMKFPWPFRYKIATIAAALFAIHPVHVEAVSGVVGRAELIFCTLLLLSLFVSLKTGVFNDLLILIFTGLGILFKETAITIPLMTVYLEYIRCGLYNLNRHQQLRRILYRRTVLCGFATIIFVILRFYIQNFTVPIFKLMDNPIAYNEDSLTRILSQQYLYAINMWILLCPQWLCFDWALGCIELITNIWDLRLQSVLALYSSIILILLNAKRNFILLLALGLLIIPFLPASGIIKVGFVIAERILYVPSLGHCLLIAYSFTRWFQLTKISWKRLLLKFMLMIVFICFLLKTRQRSAEWKTEKNLFESGLKVCPKNAKVHYNIARLASERLETEKAMSFYHNAIELYPEYEAALMNLGNLYRDTGDYIKAEKYIRKSIKVYPEFASAWMNLGIVQAAQKKYTEALESYTNALKFREKYALCYYNIGNLYLEQKKYSQAIQNWKHSLAINPRQSKAWVNLLTMLDERGLYKDAIRVSKEAMEHMNNETSIIIVIANLFGKIEHYIEAEILFKHLVELDPNNVLYQTNFAVLYHRWGKLDKAAKGYRKAIKIDPEKAITAKVNLEKLNYRFQQDMKNISM